MTITMNLEIKVGVSFEEIASVLSVMGAEHAIESGYLTGNFKYSGVYFVFRCFSTPEDVAAEGVDVDWKAGMSGAFHCPIIGINCPATNFPLLNPTTPPTAVTQSGYVASSLLI